MKQSFKYKKFLLFAVLALSAFYLIGCATIPAPQTSDSSAIIVSMRGKRKPLHLSMTPTQVFIASVDDKGYVVSEIPDSYQKGKYFYFTNLTPGIYRIARGVLTTTNTSSTSFPGGQSGFTFTTSVSSTNVTTYMFSDDTRKQTEVRLSPGQIEYMGHFSFIDSVKLWPPGATKVHETSGERKEDDEKEALDYFRKHFKKSPWVTGVSR